jgi:glutathione S-transferase
MAVELYHFWSSVCSVRCRMALQEKGVPWTSRYIDLFKFDQMRPEYLAINPRGMVPTLVHDGKPVRESSVINEYIDAAFAGPPLTPPDPLGAARMREFVYLCDEGFSAIVKLTMVKYILPKLRNRWGDDELSKQAERRPTKFYQDVHGRAVRGEITEQELGAARATIDELLDHLERTLVPGPWIVGNQFTLAEIALHVSPRCPGRRPILVTAAPAAHQRVVRQSRGAVRLQDGGVVAGRVGRRLRGGRARREAQVSLRLLSARCHLLPGTLSAA